MDFVAKMALSEAEPEITNSERNRIAHSDRAFHDWYRFVLSYPPHLVRKYINDFGLTENDLIIDPFCGTGTTVVEAKILGIPSIGIEANKFAQFAGSVKVDWNVDVRTLLEHAQSIRDSAMSRLAKQGFSDEPNDHSIDPSKFRLQNLKPDQERILLKNSISPLPMHKALVLLREIDRFKNTSFVKYFRIAFAKALVFKMSNLRFGPEVGVGKSKEDVAVIGNWYEEIEKICGDLSSVDSKNYPDSEVILSDSRDLSTILSKRKASAVITSPPYPNEKDYTRTTRLESVMLGFLSNKEELRAMKKTMLRSNTRGVYKGDTDDEFVNDIEEIQVIAEQIEKKRIELGKTSGFERMYARVTKLYFGGMTKHLIQMKEVLQPGAQLAYVVGDQASYLRVMIRTGSIIAKIAKSVGYEFIDIENFRTRFSTVTKSDLNEEVVILRLPKK